MSDTFKNEYEYDDINITLLSKVDSYSCSTRAPASSMGRSPCLGQQGSLSKAACLLYPPCCRAWYGGGGHGRSCTWSRPALEGGFKQMKAQRYHAPQVCASQTQNYGCLGSSGEGWSLLLEFRPCRYVLRSTIGQVCDTGDHLLVGRGACRTINKKLWGRSMD